MKTSAKLRQLEEENKDAMFVFVSDVWLDQVQVLEKLHIMFSGTCYFCSLPNCAEGLCPKAKWLPFCCGRVHLWALWRGSLRWRVSHD